MRRNARPRKANREEVEKLVDYWEENYGCSEEESRPVIENAYTAVFDHYITDGPGYTGKLMLVAWSGSPCFYECFIWKEGQIVLLEQAEELRGS